MSSRSAEQATQYAFLLVSSEQRAKGIAAAMPSGRLTGLDAPGASTKALQQSMI
jgi:hypothetical protein